MKKFMCIFVSLTFVFLVGCGSSGTTNTFREDVNCENIMDAIISVTEHPEADEIYLKSSDNLDASMMSLWADGLFEDCAEFELLSDYAIYVSAGTTTYEVAVFKTDNDDNIEKLTELFERRKESLANGQKGMYDPNFDMRLTSSKIEVVGKFAILLITDDNDSALEAIEKLK